MNPNNEKVIRNFLTTISNVSENKNDIYSVVIPLILSKKVFKKSAELKSFMETVLDFKFNDYVYKSRSILIGRVVRLVNELSVEDSVVLNEKVTKFLLDIIDINNESNKNSEEVINGNNGKRVAKTKKKKATSFFSDWNKYINNIK